MILAVKSSRFAALELYGAVWRRAVLLALFALTLAAITASGQLHAALLALITASKDVIADYPVWDAFLFVLLAAASAMLAFLSIAPLVPVAVLAWGAPISVVLLWLGWILGGAVAYVIARYLGRSVVGWLTTAALLHRVERLVHPGIPFHFILLFQLALPSEIPGYVLGLARYPFAKFLAALALAELPYTVATVYLGVGFVTASAGMVLVVGLAVALLSVGALYLFRRRWRRSRPAGGNRYPP
jgi:uncharacterized membrane protein YdjX (TVP38/TMEM64 family)